MYITDKKIKQCLISFIRHRYGISVEINRVYVFRYENYNGVGRDIYSVSKYPGYVCEPIPYNIPADEVDRWGMILSRKEKIEKIRENGNKEGHRRMDRCKV